ncbi:hypothetical protein J3998_07020 [Thiomicrorhabdus sp. 6S2-11]|uniref:DUF3649 domain-containing protein n=1 Tax=Thiomicrorhabdus marina TaxID=2818442 RepID=A0ABS3Q4R7_9GAMM|nr:hypothetical protein [Thiomicrorhabdus marina]MBO1927327.1 hypothetical protein [Thiomicrorhabdus marina]
MNTAQFSLMRHPAWPILSRLVLAVFGGYLLTNLVVVSVVGLLNPHGGGALLLGMSLSFLFYVGFVIWAYSVRSLAKAWGRFALTTAFFLFLTWELMA